MEYVDRRGTYSYKWDGLKNEFGRDDLLPMWIADMDFRSPSCAVEALTQYVKLPLGYFKNPDSYYEAIIQWEKKQHGYDIQKEWNGIKGSNSVGENERIQSDARRHIYCISR